jgi:hypothetical protein
MADVADDVDNRHDDELVTVYDKENHVIALGNLFPNIGEFMICFKTFAIKKFDTNTKWTYKKKNEVQRL